MRHLAQGDAKDASSVSLPGSSEPDCAACPVFNGEHAQAARSDAAIVPT